MWECIFLPRSVRPYTFVLFLATLYTKHGNQHLAIENKGQKVYNLRNDLSEWVKGHEKTSDSGCGSVKHFCLMAKLSTRLLSISGTSDSSGRLGEHLKAVLRRGCTNEGAFQFEIQIQTLFWLVTAEAAIPAVNLGWRLQRLKMYIMYILCTRKAFAESW